MKVNGFRCHEIGHYVIQCPKRKKDKKGKEKTTSTKIEDLSARLEYEFIMFVALSLGVGGL